MIVSESINPIYGNAPLAVSVYVNATGGKQAYTYSWDFGDGSSIVRTQSNTLNHIYTQPGDYNPSCTVYDASTPPLQATGATTTIRVT